jgi:hypothetical protein
MDQDVVEDKRFNMGGAKLPGERQYTESIPSDTGTRPLLIVVTDINHRTN